MTYHLGSTLLEQERLQSQRLLYGDTAGVKFGPSDTVVEFGCGPLSNFWIPQQLSAGRYYGLDIQGSQIEAGRQMAESLGLKNVSLEIGDAAHLPFPDSFADVAFARCVLIHLLNPEVVVKEMMRIVRPGGKVILIEPHDPTYYAAPDKDNLIKLSRARVAVGYASGTPDASLNLRPYLCAAGGSQIEIRPHCITGEGSTPDKCLALMANWIGMAQPVLPKLMEKGLITELEWQLAQEEAGQVDERTFVFQMMWIGEARR